MKDEKAVLIGIVTMLVIIVVTFGLIHVVVLNIGDKENNNDSLLEEIAENISKIKSYSTNIVIKDRQKMFSVEGMAVIKENYHYFKVDIDKHNGEEIASLRYDFDLIEQRYKQNILNNSTILNTNFYGDNGNIRNINYIDSTRLLIYLSEFLDDKKTKCKDNECIYEMTEYDVDTFSTMTSLITLSTISELLDDYNETIYIKFDIDVDDLVIKKAEMNLKNNVTIVLSFDSFNKVNLDV